jgi:hypothetical protein
MSDNTTQTPATTSPTLVTLATNGLLNSITHTASTGTITFQTSGVYLINVTTQVSQTVAQPTNIYLWLRKNGVDLINSNRTRSLTSATDVGSVALAYVVAMAATDYLEIYQSVSATGRNTGLYAFTPAGEPAAPSVLITIAYISL